MASPLEGKIAAQIYKGLKNLFIDATLYRDVPSNNSPDIESFDPPPPTQTSYPCKAIVETYSNTFRRDSTITAKDRKVIILANSLSVTPQNGDRIVIQGTTFTVMDVERDPASATYMVQGRM